MGFKEVNNKVDFVALERDILEFWRQTDAFNELRRLRAQSEAENGIFSFIDGPITANNPMGVHHAWGRTYKDLYQRYYAMQGKNLRWQNGFDCQGLWVEVNAEKELGFTSKRDIEKYGLANFVKYCKSRVLRYAAVQTEQSRRLGYWMDWNDPDVLRRLGELLNEDPGQVITLDGPQGPVTDTVEQLVGQLGLPELGGSYFTFSNENNYQIWGFLKKCHEHGWVYKGEDVMPWCPRCGTAISQHEIVTDGYFEVTHDSVFVRFPLVGRENEALLVWTTTPWTLSSNVAAAVGPDLDYVKVRAEDGWTYYLAEGAMKNTLLGKGNEVIGRMKGEDLVGWEYVGPFDDLPRVQAAFAEAGYTHRVVPWREVGAEEGTGIVHIAPGCGAEDYMLSKEHNLPVIAPLDENGIYVAEFGWLSGREVAGVAEDIFTQLRETGFFYRKQRYAHRYPHCWRCGSELVYRLVDEWFISMGQSYDKPRAELTAAEKSGSLRYQIMDRVDRIDWFPSFGYDREMDWLRNMHDWMISKKRYYGLALPIWECDECGHFTVIGDEHELRERAIEGWSEFEGHTPHRPYIDAIKIACPECGAKASRIADVGNPWLDAGIVAFSTLGYRQNRAYWDKWYPADLITESFPGQFRNWFYSVLAQSTVMTEQPPFRNLFGYATLFAEDGREMHKSWGNSIEFNEAAERMGADTMRWLYAGCKPEQNLLFGYTRGDETRRRFLIPLWNVYSFFVTYANLDGWLPNGSHRDFRSPVEGNAQLDQWIVARLDETTVDVRAALDRWDAERAVADLEMLLDDLSNWYVRRSRRRFWKSETDQDKQAAYATLYHVLVEFVKLLAPFIPFVTEEMYQNLVCSVDDSRPASVHHTLYPQVDERALDHRLLDKMRLAITAAALGRSARGTAGKLRQPLARAKVFVGSQQERDDLLELADVLAEEINVKEIEIVSEVGELVSYRLLPNNRVLGPKLGPLFPEVRNALAALDPAVAAATLQSGGTLDLTINDQTLSLGGDDILVQTEPLGGLAVAGEKGVTVAVDPHLTPALIREGYARDLVRGINDMRKKAGLDISDRIELGYEAEGEVAAAIKDFAAYIGEETLAVGLVSGGVKDPAYNQSIEVGDEQVRITLRKAN
ncbi:MAG TPA: class I tRNA ligase family protein [Promineifilum sp.]|nr:class I tRNA ligase family protein [Promineifilum sp.]HRQ12702.1 class I tRNA ligase family protein [Promineifilum sp.]